MLRINLLVLSFFFFLFSQAFNVEAKTRKIASKSYVPKYSAIVIDADTGRVLEQEDSHGIRHPASLTKMMTLYLTFEAVKSGRLTLNTRLTISTKASRQDPTKLGLRPGDTISVSDAIMGLITKSANDAAVVLAEHLSGSEEAFARKMTQKAHLLGMSRTIFKNASGLPNSHQVTTAHDMALLSQALYKNFPQQYKYFKHQSFLHKGISHRNHNRLLGRVHGVDGIKTGFTYASGFNLAASAVRYDAAQQPHRLIAVVLGGANRHWRDRRVTELLETNFQKLGITKNTIASVKVTDLLMQVEEEDDEENAFLEAASRSHTIEDVIEESSKAITIPHKQPQSSEAMLGIIETASQFDSNKESMTAITKTTRARPANWIVPRAPTTSKPTTKSFKLCTAQVGTYRNMRQAQKQAQLAKSQISAGEIKISRVQKGKKQMLAAQISQLTRDQAKNLCKARLKQGLDCLVLG